MTDQCRVEKTSVSETVGAGSTTGQVKPKKIKIGVHSFSAWRLPITKNSVKPPAHSLPLQRNSKAAGGRSIFEFVS